LPGSLASILIPVAIARRSGVLPFHDSMRKGRISAWLHPEAHAGGAALQAQQAMIGLGSAAGVVSASATVCKRTLSARIQTDFIFANIGEELGLIATLFVVLSFVVIAICGIYIAMRARDTFGFLLASGITFLISLQAPSTSASSPARCRTRDCRCRSSATAARICSRCWRVSGFFQRRAPRAGARKNRQGRV